MAIILSSIGVCMSADAQDLNEKIGRQIVGLDPISKADLINASETKGSDSSVMRNTRIVRKGKVVEPMFTYFYSSKTNKLAGILLAHRDIEIKSNQPIYASIKITGSDIDLKWRE